MEGQEGGAEEKTVNFGQVRGKVEELSGTSSQINRLKRSSPRTRKYWSEKEGRIEKGEEGIAKNRSLGRKSNYSSAYILGSDWLKVGEEGRRRTDRSVTDGVLSPV